MQYVSIKGFKKVYDELQKMVGFSEDDENSFIAISNNKVAVIKLDPQNGLKSRVEKTIVTMYEEY